MEPRFGLPFLENSSHLWYLVTVLLVVPSVYTLSRAFYNLYIHPLHHLPGPKLWIAFPILRHVAAIRGNLDSSIRSLHLKLGPVVRFAPNEVSFITAQAWKDIYGHGHAQLPKRPRRTPPTPDIILSNDADHARYRKALSHAFSEKALATQETLIKEYIDLLIQKLQGFATGNQPVDMVHWYNLTTFDLIGDLAFGESFGGLTTTNQHSWVANMFQFVKITVFSTAAQDFPQIFSVFNFFLPGRLKQAEAFQRRYTRDTVMRRVHDGSKHGRGDFMDSMLKHRGSKDGLTDDELVSNASTLIVAGSETTATLLSGVTYFLLKLPDVLERVTTEVRSAFDKEEDINFVNASAKLPYMLACLNEAFRLYPPVPSAFQRICLPGAPTVIDGHAMPPGTYVAVHQSAAYISPLNFHDPNSYNPTRFLPISTQDPSSPFYNDNRAVLQPFSVGPRNCVGRNLAYNEMRLILARVLWRFDLKLCDGYEDWKETQKTYLLWEKPPLMCWLTDRVEQERLRGTTAVS